MNSVRMRSVAGGQVPWGSEEGEVRVRAGASAVLCWAPLVRHPDEGQGRTPGPELLGEVGMLRTMATLVLAVTTLGACGAETSTAPVEDAAGRQPGVLQLSGWTGTVQFSTGRQDDVRWSTPPAGTDVTPPKVIEAPDTVQVGSPFDVTTYTVGSDGCWRPDGQSVTITGRVVELKPFDARQGEVCTMALVFLPHKSTVTLSAAGEWKLRVTGRRIRHNDAGWSEAVSAEKTIIAR
jgi:hypothetical protein